MNQCTKSSKKCETYCEQIRSLNVFNYYSSINVVKTVTKINTIRGMPTELCTLAHSFSRCVTCELGC